MEFEYDDDPVRALQALDEDGPPDLADAVNDALDRLEADPEAASSRNRRWRTLEGPVWMVPVRSRHRWMILWSERVVRYIGPEF